MTSSNRDWVRLVDLRRVKEQLDAALEPAEDIEAPGAVLRPSSQLFVVNLLLAPLPSSDREELLDELGEHEVLTLTLGSLRPEVTCGNPSSMTSGEWGLASFSLGRRGYFVEDPDSDSLGERPFLLLGGWEPFEDVHTYESAFIDTYVRVWDEIALPPFKGERAAGPVGLMVQALELILGVDDAIWVEKIADEAKSWSDVDEAINAAIEVSTAETGLRREIVASVLSAASRGEVDSQQPAEVRRRILRHGYLALW